MAKKFIRQIIRDDFVFPNEKRSQYGTEIYHDVNNNTPTGEILAIDNPYLSASNISFDVSWSYIRNSSELFQLISGGTYTIITFHLLAPDQDYYKPWRLVEKVTTTNSSINTMYDTTTVSATASDLGLTGLTSGTYILEMRLISKRSVTVVQSELELVAATATPTPTPTLTPTVTPVITGSCLPMTVNVYYDATTASCDELIKTAYILRSDTGDIQNATLLWAGSDCVTPANAGYYHGEGETAVRHWNGSSFDEYILCADLTPTPTPTPTVTATPPIYWYWPLYRCIDGTTDWYVKSTNSSEWSPADAAWAAGSECDVGSAYVIASIGSISVPTGTEVSLIPSTYGPCVDCDYNSIP